MQYKITTTLFFLLVIALLFETIVPSYSSETQEFQNAEIIVSSKTTINDNDKEDREFLDAYNKIIQFINKTSS